MNFCLDLWLAKWWQTTMSIACQEFWIIFHLTKYLAKNSRTSLWFSTFHSFYNLLNFGLHLWLNNLDEAMYLSDRNFWIIRLPSASPINFHLLLFSSSWKNQKKYSKFDTSKSMSYWGVLNVLSEDLKHQYLFIFSYFRKV